MSEILHLKRNVFFCVTVDFEKNFEKLLGSDGVWRCVTQASVALALVFTQYLCGPVVISDVR